MITVHMEATSDGHQISLDKEFASSLEALAYLGGYIDARPITIYSMKVEA